MPNFEKDHLLFVFYFLSGVLLLKKTKQNRCLSYKYNKGKITFLDTSDIILFYFLKYRLQNSLHLLDLQFLNKND